MKKLFCDLVPRYYGKPILVICGGPSVSANLERVPLDWPACVISANQHGYKQTRFKVDYVVSCDWFFGSSRTRMDEALKEHNPVHVNRWSWADYRIPRWDFNGDSGLAAVCVAVLLGGHPVLVLGLDRWCSAEKYFWGESPPDWKRRTLPNSDNVEVSTAYTVEFCKQAQIRVFDGPMRRYWKTSVDAPLPPFVSKQHAALLPGKPYVMLRPVFFHPQDRVDESVFLLTEPEARPFLLQKAVQAL
jgi:hypothetical protein